MHVYLERSPRVFDGDLSQVRAPRFCSLSDDNTCVNASLIPQKDSTRMTSPLTDYMPADKHAYKSSPKYVKKIYTTPHGRLCSTQTLGAALRLQ